MLTIETDSSAVAVLERMLTTRRDPHARAEPGGPESGSTSQPATASSGNRTSPVILVADDDPEVLGTIEIMLSKSGFRVVLAADGAEAADKFQRQAIDVLITDLAMPRLNGLQLAKICKRRERPLPVIMITAWGVLVDEEDQRESGVDVVLSKPVRMAEIVTAVRKLWAAASGSEPEPGSDLE